MIKTKCKHNSKLERLRIKDNKKKTSRLNVKFNSKAITNLSNRQLNDIEINALSNGLHHVYPPSSFNQAAYVCNIEYFYSKLLQVKTPYQHYEQKKSNENVRHQLTSAQLEAACQLRSIATKLKIKAQIELKQIGTQHKESIKALRNLAQDQSIIITRPDKGRGVVVMNRSEYIEKMETILNDSSTFKIIDYDPTIDNENRLNRLLSKLKKEKFITDNEFHRARPTGSRPARLYGLPKIHKEGCPLRPVMSATKTVGYGLGKVLANRLFHLKRSSHMVKDSFDFVNKIKESKDTNNIMVSFDVISLFTNIPLTYTINLILDNMYPTCQKVCLKDKKRKKDKRKNIICKKCQNRKNFQTLLEFTTSEVNFLFNGKMYIQTNGVAMGSPLAPVIADIFMTHLETTLMQQLKMNGVKEWYRFVDDTFVLIDSIKNIDNILMILNGFHESIKFTHEIQQNDCLSFLDVMVRKTPTKNQFETTVFRKKTYTGLITNWHSYVPLQYKKACIVNMIQRAIKICSTYKDLANEFQHIRNIGQSNSYPLNFIEHCISIGLNQYMQNQTETMTNDHNKENEMYFEIPYLGKTTDMLKKNLKQIVKKSRPDIQPNFYVKTDKNIQSLFKLKDPISKFMLSDIIYKIHCKDCDETYVGKTERQMIRRLYEHGAPRDQLPQQQFNQIKHTRIENTTQTNQNQKDTHLEQMTPQTIPTKNLLLINNIHNNIHQNSLNNASVYSPVITKNDSLINKTHKNHKMNLISSNITSDIPLPPTTTNDTLSSKNHKVYPDLLNDTYDNPRLIPISDSIIKNKHKIDFNSFNVSHDNSLNDTHDNPPVATANYICSNKNHKTYKKLLNDTDTISLVTKTNDSLFNKNHKMNLISLNNTLDIPPVITAIDTLKNKNHKIHQDLINDTYENLPTTTTNIIPIHKNPTINCNSLNDTYKNSAVTTNDSLINKNQKMNPISLNNTSGIKPLTVTNDTLGSKRQKIYQNLLNDTHINPRLITTNDSLFNNNSKISFNSLNDTFDNSPVTTITNVTSGNKNHRMYLNSLYNASDCPSLITTNDELDNRNHKTYQNLINDTFENTPLITTINTLSNENQEMKHISLNDTYDILICATPLLTSTQNDTLNKKSHYNRNNSDNKGVNNNTNLLPTNESIINDQIHYNERHDKNLSTNNIVTIINGKEILNETIGTINEQHFENLTNNSTLLNNTNLYHINAYKEYTNTSDIPINITSNEILTFTYIKNNEKINNNNNNKNKNEKEDFMKNKRNNYDINNEDRKNDNINNDDINNDDINKDDNNKDDINNNDITNDDKNNDDRNNDNYTNINKDIQLKDKLSINNKLMNRKYEKTNGVVFDMNSGNGIVSSIAVSSTDIHIKTKRNKKHLMNKKGNNGDINNDGINSDDINGDDVNNDDRNNDANYTNINGDIQLRDELSRSNKLRNNKCEKTNGVILGINNGNNIMSSINDSSTGIHSKTKRNKRHLRNNKRNSDDSNNDDRKNDDIRNDDGNNDDNYTNINKDIQLRDELSGNNNLKSNKCGKTNGIVLGINNDNNKRNDDDINNNDINNNDRNNEDNYVNINKDIQSKVKLTKNNKLMNNKYEKTNEVVLDMNNDNSAMNSMINSSPDIDRKTKRNKKLLNIGNMKIKRKLKKIIDLNITKTNSDNVFDIKSTVKLMNKTLDLINEITDSPILRENEIHNDIIDFNSTNYSLLHPKTKPSMEHNKSTIADGFIEDINKCESKHSKFMLNNELKPVDYINVNSSNEFIIKDLNVSKTLKNKIISNEIDDTLNIKDNHCNYLKTTNTIMTRSNKKNEDVKMEKINDDKRKLQQLNKYNSKKDVEDISDNQLRRSERIKSMNLNATKNSTQNNNKKTDINIQTEIDIITKDSAIYKHQSEMKHQIDWINSEVIWYDNIPQKLLIKETLYIKAYQPSLNRTTHSTPLYIYPEGINKKYLPSRKRY